MEQIDVVERLKTFMEFDCSTPASFAKMAGVDASNFAKMLDGKQNITKQTLKKLADAHSINMSWLLTGKGDMFIASNGSAINTGAGGVAKVEAHGDIIAVYEKLVTELRADKARLIAQNEKLIQMLADKK